MGLFKVPVVKGKDTIEVDTDQLPDAVFQEVVIQGLKALMNRGTTKITKATYPNADELKTAAMEKAKEQWANMVAGKIRATGAKSDKTSGAVMTEASRIARNLVKDEMKRQKIKISMVDAKDITAKANELIAAIPDIVEQAKANLAERDTKAAAMKDALANIAGGIKANPKKVAAAEAEKAKAKDQLSKTQAGQIAARKKPAPASA